MIRKSAAVIADEVDGVTMLCHTRSVEFFRLNSVAAHIWKICDELTIDELVGRLSEEYGEANRVTVEKAVLQFLESMSEAGLVILDVVAKSSRGN